MYGITEPVYASSTVHVDAHVYAYTNQLRQYQLDDLNSLRADNTYHISKPHEPNQDSQSNL